jgi:DNA-binding SARP family transcriptional activator/GAF domain-containing protein
MLTERGHELAASGAGASVSSTPGFSAASPVGIVHELASLATLSTSLSPDRLEQSIEQVLEWLRQASGAEAAELFLVEPQGGDMLLSAYRGPFRAAFSQITRFHPGEGFPGIVLNRGEPILTSNLPEDPFYLRTRVKDKGFHSYVCVPLLGPSGVVGVLNVATRRPHFDVERALRLLTWASQPITNVVQAGLLQVRETIGAGPKEVLPDAEQNLDAHLRAVLHKMMLVGNAVGGTLLLYDRDVQGVVRRVTEGEFAGVVCPDIRSGIPQACPALVGGHGLALSGSQRQWPAPCRQVPAGATMVYCLPMVAGGEEVGIVQLGYAGRGPSPPTKHLPALLGLAERAAQATRQAWTNLQNQQLTQSRLVAQPLADEREDPQAESPLRRRVQGAHASDDASDRPFLDIRCFGAFELYIQGRLVTSEMFQRRGALTLLKILLIHDGRQVSRDALAELLWPEADPQASANRLYVLVHTLRRVVEPAQRGQRWVFICSDGDRYYFNTEASCRLDVMDFRENLRLGERLEREEDLAGSIEAYEKAINLYRGDLLEEELYAEWCWGEREHLREMCLSALRRVARFYLEEDAPEKSVERYGQALRIDPLREENHRGLMRALLLAGRRDEALREYHLCKDNLRRELDVEPLPETEELYSLIRSNGRP